MKRGRITEIIIGIFILISLNFASAATTVSSCPTYITTSGEYNLNESISTGAQCISIESSDVIFDCEGFSIIGLGEVAGPGFGVQGVDVLQNVTIKNCNISGFPVGIDFTDVNASNILNNTIYNNNNTNEGLYPTNGIYIGRSSSEEIIFEGNVVVDNIITTFVDNTAGIYLDTNITLTNITSNNIINFGTNSLGIYLIRANSNIVDTNTITTTGSGGDGIYVYFSSYSNLTNNIINTTNGYAIWVAGLVTQDYNHTIENNTEQGDIIYYLFNNDSGIIENENVGEIFIASSNNLTLDNLTLNYDGITFILTDNSTIENSNITLSGTELGWGIGFSGSYYNNIINNTITTLGAEVEGIYMEETNHSTFTQNKIHITGNDSFVIYHGSSGNDTSGNNTFYNNLFNASTINNLSDDGFGYQVDPPTDFTWNTTKTGGTNIVEKSYLGGNYWTNNNSNGYSDTCTDFDGDYICDSPYNEIADNNTDYLPLAMHTNCISECTYLTETRTYKLNQSFTTTGTCIQIQANNIILNFDGFDITGNNDVGYGVNITDYNGTIIQDGLIYNFSMGVYLENSQDNNITNMTMDVNGINGIYFLNSSNNVLIDIISNNSGVDGIYFNSSSDNTLSSIESNNNGGDGIKTEFGEGSNNTLMHITANNNAASGVYPSNNSQLTNITVNNNTYGISIGTSNNILINITANDNNNYGLWVGGTSTNNTFTNANINNSRQDAIFLTGTTSSNEFTNIIITNTDASYYDLKFDTEGINGTWIIDSNFANYTFTEAGGLVNFKDSSYGIISFLEPINGSGTNLSSDVNIGSNLIFVNSSNNIGLNKSANITFYSITYTDSKPQYSYDGITFTDCTASTNPVCDELSYSENIFVFNTSHFTTFRAAEAYSAPPSGGGGGGGGGSSITSFWDATYTISDEQFKQGYTKELPVKNRIEVNINNGYHYIGVIEITNTTVKINVSSIPQQATFLIGDKRRFDVTGNGYYGIAVTLNGIANDKANITVLSISERVTEKIEEEEQDKEKTVTGEQAGKEPEKSYEKGIQEENLTWLWILIVIIIIFILSGVGYNKFRNR